MQSSEQWAGKKQNRELFVLRHSSAPNIHIYRVNSIGARLNISCTSRIRSHRLSKAWQAGNLDYFIWLVARKVIQLTEDIRLNYRELEARPGCRTASLM
jgi:hypothetical protein